MKKLWIYVVGVLAVTVLAGFVFVSGLFPYLSKIPGCRKQLADLGFKAGIARSPVRSAEATEINTAGCAYSFINYEKPGLAGFDLMVFDSIGIPYIYNMKIDNLLAVCRRKDDITECGTEIVEKYKDFPDGKVVTVGIINDLVPDQDKGSQPDLNFLARLKRSLERKTFYPLRLSGARIQIWSLSYRN